MFKIALLVTTGILFMASIALGQTPSPTAMEVVVDAAASADGLPLEMVEKTEPEYSGDWMAKALGILIALSIFLRGLAEALTRVSRFTKNKWDNKLAAWISEAAWILGVALGKLGYSAPKLVIEEKAKQINEKGS